jgi:subtilase family serine protease
MTIVGVTGPGEASVRPADTALNGSVAPFISHARLIGHIAGGRRLSVQLWMRPQLAAAERFATAVSTPGRREFRHYLSPDSYASRFGPGRAITARAEAWLRSRGFTDVRTDVSRSYVRATAPTSKIDAAFRVQVNLYKPPAGVSAGPYALRANNRPVSVPRWLASSVLGVTGLDNAAPKLPLETPATRPPVRGATGSKKPKPAHFPCSRYYGQHEISGLPEQFGTTTFPTEVCGYSAGQIRAGYGATGTTTGHGQTIALIELGLTQDMFRTLRDYAAAGSLPAPSGQRYSELSLGQGTTCGDFFDVEEQLDVESSYDMAPGANQLVVGGDSCNNGDFGLQGLFDADLAVIDGNGGHPLASVASNSWEGGDEAQPAALTDIEHAYLVQAAAEGVGMYFSAGDGSGVEAPSSDPYAIGVGGTTLGIGRTGNHLFETGWSTGESFLQNKRWVFEGEQGASGGGASLLWKQPGYQNAAVPPALTVAPGDRGGRVRSAPDISADADPFTGLAVGLLTFRKKKPPAYGQFDIGGTSLASPLVAGMVTAAQQGQPRPFGLISPAVYRLIGTSAVYDAVPVTTSTPVIFRGTVCDQYTCGIESLTTFDDQSTSMFGYTGQVALKGYDNMTGVGTPAGADFIAALRNLEK